MSYVKMISDCVSPTLLMLIYLPAVWGSATMKVHMISYDVQNGLDMKGDSCDYFMNTACDPKFTFCYDVISGNNDVSSCYYGQYTTGVFRNQNDVIFSQDMQGVSNPVSLGLNIWKGIKLKVKVLDNDDFNADDYIDTLKTDFKSKAAATENQAAWIQHRIVGDRTISAKTVLTLKVKVYCNPNYYGDDCATFCVTEENSDQHYNCDPQTGERRCHRGWEGENCDIFSDDCVSSLCHRGSTCVDGYRSYTCSCELGYTGRFCDVNVDDCINATFQHGRCIDGLGSYQCICDNGFTGTNCELSVCHLGTTSLCHNGGTCFGNGQCLCPPSHTGLHCEVDICAIFRCANNGTCHGDSCLCPPGFTGDLCQVDSCHQLSCLHGGNCIRGLCQCPLGYTGQLCEEFSDQCAINNPCLNGGTCQNNWNSSTCICSFEFSGIYCETILVTAEENDTSVELLVGPNWDFTPNSSATPALISTLCLAVVVVIMTAVAIYLYLRYRRRRRSKQQSVSNSAVTSEKTCNDYASAEGIYAEIHNDKCRSVIRQINSTMSDNYVNIDENNMGQRESITERNIMPRNIEVVNPTQILIFDETVFYSELILRLNEDNSSANLMMGVGAYEPLRRDDRGKEKEANSSKNVNNNDLNERCIAKEAIVKMVTQRREGDECYDVPGKILNPDDNV